MIANNLEDRHLLANYDSILRFSEKHLEIPKNSTIFVPKNNKEYLYPKTTKMRIISKSTLVEYYTKNPQSKTALEEWYEKTKKAEWTCFADIKNTFNSVDAVGNQRFVFNIKGNDYRLVVLILFTPKTVYIRFVGTHSEYDAIKDIKNI